MITLLAAALCLLGAAGNADFASIQKKFDDIEAHRYKAGTRVFVSVQELNAYAREQALVIAPKAVHDVQVALGIDALTATARVDFIELNKARGGQSNWLMDKFFQGERPVKVMLRVQTRDGKARVDVDRVEVGGAAVSGSALQFLIEHYVIPQFPDAKVAQWFTMQHRVDHVEGKPTGVTVVIGK